MRIFDRMARPFIAFVERYYPDPFVFAILLSLLGFLCAVLYTNTGPAEAAMAWATCSSFFWPRLFCSAAVCF